MKRIILLLLLTVAHFFASANMAEPIRRGTLGGSPFTSQYVDVVNEKLFIKINEDFTRADFLIEYHIHSAKDGFQIPLLFYASELEGPIEIFVDDKKVETITASKYDTLSQIKLSDFAYFFEANGLTKSVLMQESATGGFYVDWDDMIYFETDLAQGEHVIRVCYAGSKWTDGWDWVNVYSFRYALSPAKYWKSFGTLDVVIDATECNHTIICNLDQPMSGRLDSIATWHYTKLPTEILQISYTPQPGRLATLILKMGQTGFTKWLALFLVSLHVVMIYFYRRRNPKHKRNLILVGGSIIVPLLILFSWVLFYVLLNFLLGDDASTTRGYYNYLFLFYPIIMPVYWMLFWLLDEMIKTRLTVER